VTSKVTQLTQGQLIR